MFFSAQFGALSIESPTSCLEPRVANETRNSVLVDASRDHESMNHVVGGGDHADFLVNRHHQRVINL
jgi:hypothetical protein